MARRTLESSPDLSVSLLQDFSNALAPRKIGIEEFTVSDEFCDYKPYPYQMLMLKLWFLEELSDKEEDLLTRWIKESHSGSNAYPVILAPMIRERVEWLRDNGYPHFQTIQLVGGRRSGKGWMTGIALAYKVWNLIQMDDPMVYYGVDLDQEIYFPIIAASQQQAKKFQYASGYNAITGCKALRKYLGPGGEEEMSIHTPADMRRSMEVSGRGVKSSRNTAKIRVAALASSADTIRGSASMVIVFDEIAHMLPGESRRSGDQVWEAGTPSLKQFDLDGMVFANSSPWTEIGKFHDLYVESLEMEGAFPKYPDHFMAQFPSWSIYEGWEDAGFKKPLITFKGLDKERRSNPESFAVEYGARFAKIIDAFLRPESVDRMFSGVTPDGRVLKTTHAGIATFKYKGHGDPSQTGANFGIAVGHVEFFEEELRDSEGNLTGQTTPVPHVVFDLIDAFYPSDMEDGVIDWVNIVMPEVLRLIRNFRPYEWTFDQFDSLHAIQQLRKELAQTNVMDCRVHTVKATAAINKRRWDNFKAAVYLDRVHAPAPREQLNERSLELARDELKFLQLKNDKIVKQEIGPVQTKDMADCMAEVVDALIGKSLDGHGLGDIRMEGGAEGGYRMGRRGRTSQAFESFYRTRSRSQGSNRLRGGRSK